MIHIRSLFLFTLLAVKTSLSAHAETTATTIAAKDGGKEAFYDDANLSTSPPTSDTSDTAADKSVTSSSIGKSPQKGMNLTTVTPSTEERRDSNEKADKVMSTDTTAKPATTIKMTPTTKPSEKSLEKKGMKEGLHASTVVATAKVTALSTSETPSKVKAVTSVPGKKKRKIETTSTTKVSTNSVKLNSINKVSTSKPQPETYLKASPKKNEPKQVIGPSMTTQTITLFKMVPFGADFQPATVNDNRVKPLSINPFSKARIIEKVCIAIVSVLGIIGLAALLVLYFKARERDRKRSKRSSQAHEEEGLMKNQGVRV